MKILTKTEQSLLASLEDTIRRGLQTFEEVGIALLTIRDQELWLGEHNSFDEYYSSKWKLTRGRAYQLIEAALSMQDVKADLSAAPKILGAVVIPTVESHAATLGRLDTAEEKREAWSDAVRSAPKDDEGNPKITAKAVKAAVEKVEARRIDSTAEDEPAPKPKPTPKPKPEKKEEELDADAPPWAEFEGKIADLIRQLGSWNVQAREVLGYDAESKKLTEKWARYMSHMGTIGTVEQIIRTIDRAMPARLSPGDTGGFISKDIAAKRDAIKKAG